MKKILYIQFTDPIHWPVIMHGANILGKKNWDILFLGAHNIPDSSQRIQMDLNHNIRIKMLAYCAPGLMQKLQYLFYNLWVLFYLYAWKPDVVYVAEKMLCPVANFIKKNSSVILIYNELLCVNDESDISPKFLINARRKTAKIADLCILPNQPRLNKFINELGDYSNTIYTHSYPPLDEIKSLPIKEKSSQSKLKIFYHGMIGPDRLPLQLFEAIEDLKASVELTIAGVDLSGPTGYSSIIKDLIIKKDLVESVNYIGLIQDRHDLLKACSKADVGLSLVQKSIQNGIEPEFDMAGGAQRPFEHMALGLVPLVTDVKDWHELFVIDGYGFSCNPDDTISIKELLLDLYKRKDELYEIGQKNREKILNDWNYDYEFKKIEYFLEKY